MKQELVITIPDSRPKPAERDHSVPQKTLLQFNQRDTFSSGGLDANRIRRSKDDFDVAALNTTPAIILREIKNASLLPKPFPIKKPLAERRYKN